MKNVNEALKSEIKEAVEMICGIRAQINQLKWNKPGDATEFRRLKGTTEEFCSSCMTAGCRTLTEAEKRENRGLRKALRRPETGPKRAALWGEKRAESSRARYLMLAYGALRGRAYAQLESKCREDNKPSSFWLTEVIHRWVEPSLRSVWTQSRIDAWLKGSPLLDCPQPMLMEASA